METAKDILEKITCNGMRELTEERVLQALKEISDKAWAAGRSHEHASHFGSVPNVHPDKSTFMKITIPGD